MRSRRSLSSSSGPGGAGVVGANTRRGTLSTRILLSLTALGAAAAIAGMGTFASFTSTTSASQSLTAGAVSVTLGAAGGTANRLTLSVTGIVPDDTISRAVDLTSSSTDPLASVSLTTTAPVSSVLNTDAINGLKMTVQRCTVAWTEANAPAYTYTCSGTASYVLGTSGTSGGLPVIQTAAALPGLAALSAGSSVDHLVVTLYLPTAAPNTMQSATSTIQYAFTGTQRAGAPR